MKFLKLSELSEQTLGQLLDGAFLTVRDKDGRLNTMTIAWGTIGYMWFKPIFMVMVRNTRHTFELMENAGSFSVSLPLKGQLKDELSICGTKSGRDINKFDECGITEACIEDIKVPVIGECDLHIVCDMVYKQALDPSLMDKSVLDVYGANNDYHTLYYGEIKALIKDGKKVNLDLFKNF